MKKISFTGLLFLLIMISISAQEKVKKRYSAIKIESEKPIIDGKLNEAIWETALWDNSFTQYEPYDGQASSQKTQFAIFYDDTYLYIGLKMWDTKADEIVKRMTRRDQVEGDVIGVEIDSYHDLRTSFAFYTSAAGVKYDFIKSNDGDNQNSNWDPIWWVKTSSNKNGWEAEMKIPFTQLRFGNEEEQIWGLQLERIIYRSEEISLWQAKPKNESGWVHHFGELEIKNIKPKKVFDLSPYAVGGFSSYEAEEGNPFADGKDFKYNVGIDGKLGITNNLTMDFTINPDFGQVEADPSEVNLTAFESFFQEKRPFFIEGKDIISFPVMFGDGDLADENLFYSRRIGRRPHNSPELGDNEYAKIPDNTSILSAIKLTGKTKNGISIGILESVTQKEMAEITDGTNTRYETVEPLTSYTVGRMQKDLNNGNTMIGGIITSTNRFLEGESHLDYLHKSAYSGGIDFTHLWNNKQWMIQVSNMFSNVNGTSEAITLTQKSSARYFQRPDASHLTLDTNKTALNGYGGKLVVGKMGGGNFKYALLASWKSPGLELNDVGFLRQADDVFTVLWGQFRTLKPFGIIQRFSINTNWWHNMDFAGNYKNIGGNFNFSNQFTNYWWLNLGINFNSKTISTNMLRGGSRFETPESMSLWYWTSTNSKNSFYLTHQLSYNKSAHQHNNSIYANLGLNYKPSNTLSIAVYPSVNARQTKLQYVKNGIEFNGEDRYIFASIDQKVLNLSLRINYNITPELSLQYWGQPFIATGKYKEFKMITDGMAETYTDRFAVFAENQIQYDETEEEYLIDENTDGQTDYSFSNPDFNYKEFLSNMVLRWEFNPGSALYFVWSQSRDHFVSNGDLNFSQDLGDLFSYAEKKSHNVFMLKFSYRFAL